MNMREKYETLSLAVLRDLAKARGMKRISTLRKAELIDAMVAEDDREAAQQKEKADDAGTKEIEAGETKISAGTEKLEAEQEKPEAGPETPAAGKTKQSASTGRKRSYAAAKKETAVHTKKAAANTRKKTAGHTVSRKNSSAAGEPAVSEGAADGGKTATGQDGKTIRNKNVHAVRHTASHTVNRSAVPRVGHPVQKEEHTEQKQEFAHDIASMDNGITASGILEVMQDGYGFIRSKNYLPGSDDVYVSPSLIRRFNLKTGDIIVGNMRNRSQGEKFGALLYVSTVNGYPPYEAAKRPHFEDLTPIFPNERIRLETNTEGISMRIMDLVAPVGKGQRGMIVSPPKAGKTTLLKDVAHSIKINNPEMHLIVLLIDERPEEVTDIKEAIEGERAEVIYSTFDELPEHHKRVSEMVIERAKRLVEHNQDVIILLDSITRLARAYNLVVPPSGRTLSGGLDPAALHMPKRFFGAARNTREGGSLTILATALVDTGSKMDDVVYEEFKGTGNMEVVLDRKLSERRIFPAIDIVKSGTRREDLLLEQDEQEAVVIMRKGINGLKTEEAVESILRLFVHTRTNQDFVNYIRKRRIF